MVVTPVPSATDHEAVLCCRDEPTGLRALIAIHDTTLGPAAGGCRMWPYANERDALCDALRLSRGMSYKSALAELPFGGGKSVILGDPARDKTPELLRAFGRFVESLAGRYVAAEDVGISVRDVETIADETGFVAGLASGRHASGDPSPLTAQGVLVGMRAAVAARLGRDSLVGVRVAVQGVGAVGGHLCRMLHSEGARLVVADVNDGAVREAVTRYGADTTAPDAILSADVDVFAPCALGAVLDDAGVSRLRAVVVAGSANNQLATPRHGDALARRGVLYAPDYVINAGGIINVAGELAGDHDPDAVLDQIEGIGPRVAGIFREAARKGSCPGRVADAMARARLEAASLRGASSASGRV